MELTRTHNFEILDLVKERILERNIDNVFVLQLTQSLNLVANKPSIQKELVKLLEILNQEDKKTIIHTLSNKKEILSNQLFHDYLELLLDVGSLEDFRLICSLIEQKALSKRKLPLLKKVEYWKSKIEFLDTSLEKKEWCNKILETDEIVRALTFTSSEWKNCHKRLAAYFKFQLNNFYLRKADDLLIEMYECVALLSSEIDDDMISLVETTLKEINSIDKEKELLPQQRGLWSLNLFKNKENKSMHELVASIKLMSIEQLNEQKDELIPILMECEEYDFLDSFFVKLKERITDEAELINLGYVEALSFIERSEYVRAMEIIDYWIDSNQLTKEEIIAFRRLSFKRR